MDRECILDEIYPPLRGGLGGGIRALVERAYDAGAAATAYVLGMQSGPALVAGGIGETRARAHHRTCELVVQAVALGEDFEQQATIAEQARRIEELERQVDAMGGVIDTLQEKGRDWSPEEKRAAALEQALRAVEKWLVDLGADESQAGPMNGDAGALLVLSDVRGALAATPPQLPALDLLRKFASGEGGRRTGDLMRRNWLRVEVTPEGLEALRVAGDAGG
jgi:hypothetical protein